MITLKQLQPGQHCRVLRVHGQGPTYQRLLEMGLISGTELSVVRFAPLGDPMEVHFHGFNLSLRTAEASLVEVEVISSLGLGNETWKERVHA